jgi:hypothetical protein
MSAEAIHALTAQAMASGDFAALKAARAEIMRAASGR